MGRSVLHIAIISSLLLTSTVMARAQAGSPELPLRQVLIRVDGASCPFCAFGLEKRLGRLDGVQEVRLEMKAGQAIVTLKKGAHVSEEELRKAVDEAGFTPGEITYAPPVAQEAEREAP